MQPKPFLAKLRYRNHAIGNERRRNMSKIILEYGTPLPKGVEYKDIDTSVKDWADNLDIAYNGQKLPLFQMFSNQRLQEYAQTWQHLDETGNLLLNFKTITRENNPKKGDNQGSVFNIPGDRDYPMFIVPILQENGEEAYDMYSMKQPFCVDLFYSISLVTNHFELLNDMNQMIHDRFKAINAYISPNGHYMPMVLEDITDESEYSIDDRKYFSQTYKIKVKAYIIQEKDFKVTHLPSRVNVKMLGVRDEKKPQIEIKEEDYVADECCLREEYDPYYNKLITLNINIPTCTKIVQFTLDVDCILRGIETNNIYDMILLINDEEQDLASTNDIRFYDGDKIKITIERDDEFKPSILTIKGFDPNVVLDERYNPESSLDDEVSEEIIDVNSNE